MQSIILKRIGLQRLFRNNFHLRYADFYNARCFASQRRETFGGVTGIKRVAGIKRGTYAKKKREYDPDEEFMQLWSTSEGYIKNMFQEAKRETSNNTPMRKYGNTFMTQNVSTLPLASELTKDEIEQLPEDSGSVDFRIPDAEDFAGLTPEYKSLKEQELKDDEVVELRNVDDKERDKNQAEAESDVVDTSKILSFQDFDLHPKLIEKLTRDGITVPTAIQKQAIPLILKRKSILIQSETGSGKTLVFLLPALQYPGKAFGTLIIVPTRELASQMLYEARRFLGDKSIVESFVSLLPGDLFCLNFGNCEDQLPSANCWSTVNRQMIDSWPAGRQLAISWPKVGGEELFFAITKPSITCKLSSFLLLLILVENSTKLWYGCVLCVHDSVIERGSNT